MSFYGIKFRFCTELIDSNHLDSIFAKIDSALGFHLDENLNPYPGVGEDVYEFKDLSHLNSDEIENEINSFFNFDFPQFIDEQLYKFLVLKNNDKLTVLANIHSSIFDYSSIPKFCALFDNCDTSFESELLSLEEASFGKDILNHYDQLKNYLKSSEFKEDSSFWKKHIEDIGNYIKFYNVKSNNFKSIKIPFNAEAMGKFSNQYNASRFEIISSALSLYLSRIDRMKGCLFKTLIPRDDLLDMESLLKIEYFKDYSFIEHISQIKELFNLTAQHTKSNIDNYIGYDLSIYSIYDFTSLKGISIINGEGTALTFNVYDDFLELVFNSDLFSQNYIDHMAGNIGSLIDNLLISPDQLCNEIDILSSEEKDLISTYSQGKKLDVDISKTLAMAFCENAIKYPDMLAVDDGVSQVSYSELEHSVNSIAYDLKNNHGINFGDCVGLMLPRTYHFPELVLALNKIGAAFTPIDPNYPLNRIEHMLSISESNFIITTREFAQYFNFNKDLKILYMEDLRTNLNDPVEFQGSADDLFAIFFTSGTTGLPKGVMVSNKQIMGMAVAFKDLFKTSVGNLMGYFASFSFIASIRLFVTFIFGESCRIFNETEQKDSLLLIKTLKSQEMSDLILPPSVGIPIFEKEDIKVKYLILAGAKLNELTNKESTTRLVNFYGTTELIMGIVNIYDLSKGADRVPIGKPVANTWAYILDDEGRPLPIGVPGEICISSDYISPGYYNQVDLTNEVFVDNPNSTCDDNKRMYRTGDIGFYNFDGEIEILGREDNQLSVRGFRIESGEILSIMNNFSHISDVYLDVDNDTLIAYYVSDGNFDIDEVKKVLKDELPYYMIPSLFIELDKIPLNPNGKIDKFALKDSFNQSSNIDIEDEVLKSVVDGFKKVLNADFVLLNDEFISLGGTSLAAMSLQLYLNEKLGVHISSNEIMELSSPINIANHIKYNLDVHSVIGLDYSFNDLCPLSESQLNVYLDESVNDMGTAYNNPFKIEFGKKYSVDGIKNAIEKLFEAYPVLNSRVMSDGDKLSFSFDAEVEIDMGTASDIASFVRPFELDKNLSRFLIVEDDESNCLCVDFHHLIFDGRSGNIIFDGLISLLKGEGLDFVDNGVLRQISYEENISSDYMDDAHEFFDSLLADRDEVFELLPSIKMDKNNDFVYIDRFNLDDDEFNSFLNIHSITPNQFFCSVFAYTLSRFTGSSKVLFNLIEDGRGHIDLSESVGMFVRTLPLIIDCKDQNVSSFLDYSSDLINSAMKYDLYPFRLLANQYDLSSDILFQYSHNLFSNLDDFNDFNVSNDLEVSNDLKELNNLTDNELDFKVDDLKQESLGDLSFYIFNINENELAIKILYSDKFSYEFIKRFADSYKLIFNQLMKETDLSDIDYMSESDLVTLDYYNRTKKELDYDDILDAFNDNLSRYPKAKIVSYKSSSYSYDEAAFIADIISKKLSELGVKLQDSIPFFVERSELYMFSTLAILSAGCIYVPLDDSLPDERIKFMLKDCGSHVVIVSDETFKRSSDLFDEDIVLLNISEIVNGDIGTLSHLPVCYGDLACILYTSGTTGLPKGVKIRRKGILNFADYYVNQYGMDSNSVFGLFASIGFDVGAIRGICAPIYGGSTLDIVPMDIRLDMDKLNSHFIEHNVTHTTLPTQVARMFIEQVENDSLKVLNTGGEKLGDIQYSTPYTFIDSYGPTESCVAICDIEAKEKIDPSSIGHLFPNIKAYVLDEEGRRVPIGAVGELCIAGNQIAEGYLNRDEETKKAFLDNPFDSNDDYALLYRTGDLVRVLEDGTLAIVGRSDSQVKIRGNRVELLEVEAIIREMDSVESVTVQTIEHNGNFELVAYIVAAGGNEDIEKLKDSVCKYVAGNKPDYMVPSFVVKLDEIPLTVNGKVDKRGLPEVDKSLLYADYVAPRNEKERDIANAFEKIFDMEKISIYDDFIRLGGDSLNAINLLSYLEKYDVTTSDIFSLRTPEAIAKSINDISLDLDIYTVEGGCPLNGAQVNLFADLIINDNFDFYQIPTYINIPKKYGLEKILSTLDEMFRIHPILAMHLSDRYAIHEKKNIFGRIQDDIAVLKELGSSGDDDGGTDELMKILRNKGWNIKRIYDMFRVILKLFKGQYPYLVRGSNPPVTVESEFSQDTIKDFFNESFDLYNYLSMYRIVELEDSYLLLAKCHHIIFDGISSTIFKHDFQRLLDGAELEIDDSFLRISAFTHQIRETDKFAEASEFYDSMLMDIREVKALPKDKQEIGFSVNSYDLEFDHNVFNSFLEDNEISENILFTSVFALTMSIFTKSNNVSFAMIENGRDRFNDYDSIGLYAGVVPLLLNCTNQSIASFIDHSSENIYGVLKYNYIPVFQIAQKYGFDISTIFQYVPNWVSYDVIKGDDSEILSADFSGNLINDLVGNMGDLIANFIVQVFQDEGKFSLLIVNSNNFSLEMINDFKDAYMSILSNIINADLSADLNSILNDDIE